ncbi:uncharacterized protein LOC117650819 [Thrips palmi]|uniref:Uncharacterized protein LOC117650819 n=1 Tax=Thrips palmi TaxID=161013 RepID=A0A6P8ZZ05_THRPL|nr:uncharacterized protein LOC117650819 [Thrips palmi]
MPVKESTRSSRRVARRMAKPNPGASTSRMTSQDPAAGPSKMASEDPAAGSSKMGDQDRGAGPRKMSSQDPDAGPRKMSSQDHAAGSSKMGDQDPDAGPRKMSSQDPDAGPRKMSSQDHAAGSSKMGDQDSGADSTQVDEQAPGAGPSMMGDEGPGAGPSKMGDQDSDAVPRLASLDSAAGKSRLYAARMGRSARTLSFNLESIDLDPAATNQKDFLAPRPPTPAPSSGNSFVSWFSRIGLLLSALNCCAPRGEATSNAGTPPTPVGAEILGSAASGNSGASNISAGSSSSSSSVCERAPPKNCFRLLLQGSPCTGKSTMARRFLNHDLPMFYSPTIEQYYSMVFRVEKERFELDIVDKSGYNPFPEAHRLSNITGA